MEKIIYRDDFESGTDGHIVGVFEQSNGSWDAMTTTQSKNFKTKANAIKWLEKRLSA